MKKFSRQGGALLVGILCTLIAGSHTAATQGALPPGWTDGDIGTPAITGSTNSSGDTITIRGGGADIGDTSDEFHFAYQEISGDIDISVQVADLQDVSRGAKAGLMIRESLTADAKNAFILVTDQPGLAFQGPSFAFQWRSQDGHRTAQDSGGPASPPAWVRLVRQGKVFRAYSSPTGEVWTLVGSAVINMNPNAYVGLAVTSHDPSQTATAVFSSPAFGSFGSSPPPSASSLPAPWIADDIGNPALPGSASESGGTFTVTGAGTDIWSTSDQFQFVYQPVTGDTQIVARLGGLQATDGWSKAEVMIRESLTGSAANAAIFASGSNGWGFTRRLSAGGSSHLTSGSAGAASGWFRLVREGNLFSAYQSPDGSQWTLIGSDTIAMPATVYVGLAITSVTPSAAATATFSNVAVSAPTSGNTPPTVSISAPASGATYTAPASIAISATAGDVDGSVARVDFYAGTRLVSSDTTSPFTTTWSNVSAGVYSLSAVATDNEGATATSQPISVTVAATEVTTPLPTTLIFVPSVDNATNVDSYTVELRRSVDNVTASPVAVTNLGKPAVVGGEISVLISTLVDPLPAGSYYAVVVASGPGGSTPSTPSAVFSK